MNLEAIVNTLQQRGVRSEIHPSVLSNWRPTIMAAADDASRISILEPIGEDYFGEGVSARRISAALRSIGEENPVHVVINSPGGSMFEGIAIMNLLRNHAGPVSVDVVGLAASAASLIAMAASPGQLRMSPASFLMIHNAWGVAVGNRHDMQATANALAEFDAALAQLYVDRSGLPLEEVTTMMDQETWLAGSNAVTKGLADEQAEIDIELDDGPTNQLRLDKRMDQALARAGMTRSERRDFLKDYKASTRNAAADSTPPAAAHHNTQNAVDLTTAATIAADFKNIFKRQQP